MRRSVITILFLALQVPAAAVGTVSVFTEPTTTEAPPANTVSSLFPISETDPTPVFGYSLDIDVAPEAGALDAVTASIQPTNFFDQGIQHVYLRDWRAVHTRFDKGQSARSDRFAPTPRRNA